MESMKISPSITKKRTNVTKNDGESNDDTTKSPSVTAAQNPTKKDQNRNIFNEKPQSFVGMKKRKSRNMEIEKKN